MRLPLTLAALLIASLAAGCIGAPGKTMTAREGLDDARSAAEEWADGEDLELLGIVAIEPFKRIRQESQGQTVESAGEEGIDVETASYEAEYVTHLDGNPGDGRAPGWAYGFATGERCISVVLAAGLGVLAEGYETCDETAVAMPDWSVDSDEAAEILQGHDEWPDLGESGTYFWGLFGDDGQALWTVAGMDEEGDGVYAVVDAESGEVVAIEDEDGMGLFGGGFESEPVPEQPAGGEGGSDEDVDDAPFMTVGDELAASVVLGDMGGLQIGFNANVAVVAMSYTVEGPYGVVEEGEIGGNAAVGNPQETRNIEDLPAGQYTVTLTANGAAVFPTLRVVSYW